MLYGLRKKRRSPESVLLGSNDEEEVKMRLGKGRLAAKWSGLECGYEIRVTLPEVETAAIVVAAAALPTLFVLVY